jgi:hypothetical protein
MTRLIRWWLRKRIAYLERMIASTHDDADVQRDGELPDYWRGKRHGLKVALHMLFDMDTGGWDE